MYGAALCMGMTMDKLVIERTVPSGLVDGSVIVRASGTSSSTGGALSLSLPAGHQAEATRDGNCQWATVK